MPNRLLLQKSPTDKSLIGPTITTTPTLPISANPIQLNLAVRAQAVQIFFKLEIDRLKFANLIRANLGN